MIIYKRNITYPNCLCVRIKVVGINIEYLGQKIITDWLIASKWNLLFIKRMTLDAKMIISYNSSLTQKVRSLNFKNANHPPFKTLQHWIPNYKVVKQFITYSGHCKGKYVWKHFENDCSRRLTYFHPFQLSNSNCY